MVDGVGRDLLCAARTDDHTGFLEKRLNGGQVCCTCLSVRFIHLLPNPVDEDDAWLCCARVLHLAQGIQETCVRKLRF